MQEYTQLPYRLGALAIVFDDEGNVLVVQLNDYTREQWAFPGGGRLEGESGEQNVVRELTEELGVPAQNFEVIAKSSVTNKYDFPDKMRKERVPVALQYRGQAKDQYFVRFVGDKSNIAIDTNELRAYKWIAPSELKDHLIFEGQYELAEKSLAEYRAL